MTFRVTAFPAGDGDALLLSYGSSPARHVLIDGGRKATYSTLKPALQRIVGANERIELLVLSHIDADHIEGLLQLVADEDLGLPIKEIWFNGYDELFDFERLGFAQADTFSNALRGKQPTVNMRFGGKALVIPDSGPLPRIELDGGLSLILLSPDQSRLLKLRTEWAMWRGTVQPAARPRTEPQGLEVLGRKPMPQTLNVDDLADSAERPDTETPNGSSIAFIAEFAGRKALLAADAHPSLLAESISRLIDRPGHRYAVDLCKVSHHGSIGNTTRALLETLQCGRFLFSTDGSRHGHPDPEAVAKILKYSPTRPLELSFNYATVRTLPWNDEAIRVAWHHTCRFGADDHPIEIDL
jgi:beta-lactamase superfamily II metal-dependent hydrolase